MSLHSTLYRLTAPALILAALSGCDHSGGEPVAPALDAADARQAAAHGSHARPAHGPEVNRWLAQLRSATAKFHDIDAADAAGWDAQITGCMELPGTGGMGYHYGNADLIDGVPEALRPELLVYEPQKNGRKKLVAVEYIIPYTEHSKLAPAPSLHGVDFHRNDGFGLWVLHAWVWKHNPAGMFADWNPNVNCDFAD